MKLIKATRFRTEYFHPGSEPDIKTLKKCIDAGELPGKGLSLCGVHRCPGNGQSRQG